MHRTMVGLLSPERPMERRRMPPTPAQPPPPHVPMATRLAAEDPDCGGDLASQGSNLLELAWRVVHAAEQRKVALMERTRPLASRARQPLVRENSPQVWRDRPVAATGSRAEGVTPPPRPSSRHILGSPCVQKAHTADQAFLERELAAVEPETPPQPGQGSQGNTTPVSTGSRRRPQSGVPEPETASSMRAKSATGRPLPNILWAAEGPVVLAGAGEAAAEAAGAAAASRAAPAQEAGTGSAGAIASAERGRAESPREQAGLPPKAPQAAPSPPSECPREAPTPSASSAPSSRQSGRGAKLPAGADDAEAEATLATEARACDPAVSNGYPEVLVTPPNTTTSAVRRGSAASVASTSGQPRAVRRNRVGSVSLRSSEGAADSSGVAAAAVAAAAGNASGRVTAAIRRSKSMPVAENKRGSEEHGKSNAAPMLRKGRTSGSSGMSKSTATAAAGAGSVATRVRKRAALLSSKKMALPFAYPPDDPRFFHIESTGGLMCPAFLAPP